MVPGDVTRLGMRPILAIFGKVPTPVFNANTGGKAQHRIRDS